jgi:hypothetical protein
MTDEQRDEAIRVLGQFMLACLNAQPDWRERWGFSIGGQFWSGAKLEQLFGIGQEEVTNERTG